MSSKNTHLYQDYHQIFHLRRLNFFQNMYFVYLCKQKFDILKKPSQFRFSFEIVLYYVKLINFFPINFLVDFVSRFPKYVPITSKASPLGEEENLLQNYCKMINPDNVPMLPIKTVQARPFLFQNSNLTNKRCFALIEFYR